MKRILIALILMTAMCGTITGLPSSYDGRDLGHMTPVKDQGGCGCCGAFATVAMLESAILADGGALYDLSEQQAKECAFESLMGLGGGCDGGTAKMAINVFTTTGAQSERDSPYIPLHSKKCNYGDNPVIRITDWHVLSFEQPPSRNVIKQAIVDHGAVYTTINERCLPRDYDGKSVIRKTSNSWYGHAVIIVGWDDSRRCWIVKNSWGTGWGDEGYGYIRYDTGNIGAFASVISDYELYDSSAKTLNYDEAGWTYSYGIRPRYLDYGWEMCIFDQSRGDDLQSIEFWTTAPATVELRLYDSYRKPTYNRGGGFGKLLYERKVVVKNAGYHSVDLPRIRHYSGDIVVTAKFANDGGEYERYPLAIDTKGLLSKNTYISMSGRDRSWWLPGVYNENGPRKHMGDSTLRLRMSTWDKPSISKVKIEADRSTTLSIGDAAYLVAFCYSGGRMISHHSPIEWKCSDQAVGHISPEGEFVAKQNGRATITAICNGRRSNSIVVTVADEPEPEPTPEPTPKPAPSISWEFGTVGNTEGWGAGNIEYWSVDSDGRFRIDPGYNDPWIMNGQISLDATRYNTVKMNMASNAPDGYGAIYFITSGSPSWSEDKKVNFGVTIGGGWRDYSIVMGNHPLWAGTITGLRIDPAKRGLIDSPLDCIGFDYIRVEPN